jgi:hypothetical protein
MIVVILCSCLTNPTLFAELFADYRTGMKYWPQWTRRVVTEETGRDPLGLSLVSDALTEFLLPGIPKTASTSLMK